MKYSFILFALLLVGCSESTSQHVMTYEELEKYPVQCAKADSQLLELRALQKVKNFAEDPDDLNDADRAYNSRLKATIWWFAYQCDKA